SGATCVRAWPPLRTRSTALLVRNTETCIPAVMAPLARVKPTEDTSESMPLVMTITSLSVSEATVGFLPCVRCRKASGRHAPRSLAGFPNPLIDRQPDPPADDVLSAVLRAVRLTGSLQFCFMPTGDWQTDATPSLANLGLQRGVAMPFHI